MNGYRNDHFLPYLFKSEDNGASWEKIGLDLPFEPLNVVREDPKYDSVLYVGSDGGLYVSLNQGNNFMAWKTGLPSSIPVHDLAIQTRENELVVGTHGRSLFVGSLDPVQQLMKDTELRKKKEAEVAQLISVANGTASYLELYKREGIEVPCPPAPGSTKTKIKAKKK
jgi:photosystem II stability/assembly factor-like uncharacterized protein